MLGVMMRFFCLTILAFLCAQGRAQSFEYFALDYAPFLNGQPWPKVPLTKYTESTSNTWVHPSAPQKSPTIQLLETEDADFTTIVLRFPDGRTFKTYCDAAPSPFAPEVYSGDLNGDGVPDFMVVKPGSGCGIAAEYCTGVFAFSEGKDYYFTRINTMGLGPHDLVLDPETKSFRLIHTSLCAGMTPDGRYHSFWVHRFFKWEYGAFRKDPNFPPIWIQYLYRPNHEATKLLTPELKAKFWSKDSESEVRIEW